MLDGRDIGTVICPDADVKLFVTATPEERARRRYLELKQAGVAISEADVLADIRRRDERDKDRAAAPLRQAPDAYLLDTTNLDIDAAFRAAIDLIDAAMGRAGYAELRQRPFRIGTTISEVFREILAVDLMRRVSREYA